MTMHLKKSIFRGRFCGLVRRKIIQISGIERNVKSRDWPFPKWNICYMSIIMYNYPFSL